MRYGFLTGAAGQYDPIITLDNTTIGVPEGENGELHDFPDAFTDKSIRVVVLADAGHWHQLQMQALATDGITVLVAPDADKRQGTRPGWNGGFYAFMRRVLATPAGAALYRRRSGMIEPVFADTKFNRKIDRFLRRGRAACRSEWRLITATHNLRKLHQHRLASAA